MKNVLLILVLMSMLVPCTMHPVCKQLDLIKCKSLWFCEDKWCEAYERERKAKEKKKLNPYSRADLVDYFIEFRTNQESIVKKLESIVKQIKGQMKKLKGLKKGDAELTKQ